MHRSTQETSASVQEIEVSSINEISASAVALQNLSTDMSNYIKKFRLLRELMNNSLNPAIKNGIDN